MGGRSGIALTWLVLIVGVSAAGSQSARASSFCEIKPTPDGFVALRAGPGVSSAVKQRMRPGDEVQLGTERSGKWISVTYWKGGRFRTGNPAGDPPTDKGWVHSDFIVRDSCG